MSVSELNVDMQSRTANYSLDMEDDFEKDVKEEVALVSVHCERTFEEIKKGRRKGQQVVHFKCLYCPAKYQGPATSAFNRHLREKHPEAFNRHLREKHPEVDNKPDHSKRASTYSKESFLQCLTDLIVTQDLPFQLVESPAFREFIDALRPSTEVVTVDELEINVMNRFEKMKNQMKNFWTSIDSRISFTTEIWTGPNDMTYLAITAHWISSEFIMQHLLMDFIELHGSNSGVDIEKAFSKSLIENDVFSKKLAITLDNSYSNDTFISAFMKRDPSFDKEHQVRCFGHIVNQIAQDALELVDDKLSYIRNYIESIIHSPKRLEQLQDFYESMGKDFENPTLDVKTEWNSTTDMMIGLLQLKDGLSSMMKSIFHEASEKSSSKRRKSKNVTIVDNEEGSFVQITDQHWKNISDILAVIEPLKISTKTLSEDNFTPLNTAVIAYAGLVKHLEQFSGHSDLKAIASKAALKKLAKYYNISSEICSIPTVLDPRLKLNFHKAAKDLSVANPEEIRSYVTKFYNEDYAPSDAITSQNSSPVEPSMLDAFYQHDSPSHNQTEIEIYLSEPVVNHHSNFKVLDYWKINSARFPNLSRMARDYLAVPGISTPSEWAFNGGKQSIANHHHNLSGQTIKACVLLRHWMRHWDDAVQPHQVI